LKQQFCKILWTLRKNKTKSAKRRWTSAQSIRCPLWQWKSRENLIYQLVLLGIFCSKSKGVCQRCLLSVKFWVSQRKVGCEILNCRRLHWGAGSSKKKKIEVCQSYEERRSINWHLRDILACLTFGVTQIQAGGRMCFGCLHQHFNILSCKSIYC